MTVRSACARALATTLALAGFALNAGAAESGAATGFAPAAPETWTLEKADLFDVAASGTNVWAVGYWGTVVRSSDGGESWTLTRTPTRNTLFSVAFGDAQNGWAVGERGVILRSTDGGATWTHQVVETIDEAGEKRPLGVNLMAVAAQSPTEAWAVGDLGVVLRTRDGASWELVTFDATVLADDNLPERIFNAVAFSSPTEGYIAGEFATLLRTTDGGNTWTGQRTLEGAPDDLYFFALDSGPAGKAAATGLAGSVIVTGDGGKVWSSKSVDTRAGLFAIAWSGEKGVAVGDRGVIFVTGDGGANWADPKRPSNFNWLAGATFVDEARAIAVGEGGLILRSTDSGRTWNVARTPASRTKLEGDPGAVGGEPMSAPKTPDANAADASEAAHP